MAKQASLTEAQNKVFNFISRYVAEHKRPPAIRDIQKQMKYKSTNAVADVLAALESKGYILRRGGARSIEVLAQSDLLNFGFGSPAHEKVLSVSVMNSDWQAKGEKLKSIGNVYLDKFFTKGKSCILLQVDDDGMDKSGILKRDMVLVERREIAESEKEILIAAICEEGVIVRIPRIINERLHLVASNRSYSERIIIPKEPFPEAVIVGVVISLVRSLMK